VPVHRAVGVTCFVPAIAALFVASCGGDDAATSDGVRTESASDGAIIDPGDGGRYAVDLDPARFTSRIDHPYLPLLPGSRWVYESRPPDGEEETIVVEVLDERRMVMGIEAIVVHDTVTDGDGALVEDTYDWYAQDGEGSVWYLGEDTTSYDSDVPSTAGSWEAGVGGALPGIVMPGTPKVSDIGYRQEFLAGEAEDMGQVIAVTGSIAVPAGEFDDVIVTRDWTPLEPDVVEQKTYAPGVGFVHEIKTAGADAGEEVVLVEFEPGD
jgi:hypothetical protein